MARLATQIPEDVFDHIARNAGVILNTFSTDTWTLTRSAIKGATSGGINFVDTPTYTDYGDDIDNCPKNTKELKEIDSREVKVSGTFVSVDPSELKNIIAAADYDSSTKTITPRDTLSSDDFKDLWFVCDYGNGGAIAVQLKNCLSTAGLNIQTGDRAKGTFAFEFQAHYSLSNPESVPYKIYIKEGSNS